MTNTQEGMTSPANGGNIPDAAHEQTKPTWPGRARGLVKLLSPCCSQRAAVRPPPARATPPVVGGGTTMPAGKTPPPAIAPPRRQAAPLLPSCHPVMRHPARRTVAGTTLTREHRCRPWRTPRLPAKRAGRGEAAAGTTWALPDGLCRQRRWGKRRERAGT
jgi:hypothetical protein